MIARRPTAGVLQERNLAGMGDSIRVMIERGKKKRVVAVAFDWPGWDRSAKTEEGALQVLDPNAAAGVVISLPARA